MASVTRGYAKDCMDERPEADNTRGLLSAPARRHNGVWIGIAGLLLLGGAGWYVYGGTAPAQVSSSGGRRPNAPQTVGVSPAVKSGLRRVVNALGTVTPLASVTVKTQLSGQLQLLGFSEGQFVHKGDFLAQIDPRPYQALVEQYEGQIARDRALLRQAQADLERYRLLVKQDSIARQQADNQVFLVQQYEGSIKSDQALIDAQKLNITYCRIVSPVDGRVGLRQVDAGNYVQAADANGIVSITQTQPVSVVFSIPEDVLPAVLKPLREGGKLTATAFDRANVAELATGVVSALDNQIDTTTGMVKLRSVFSNVNEALYPNQFVNVHLLVATLNDVVTIPGAAVQRGSPGTYVYLVKADSTVTVRPVQTGITDGDKVQVVSGLAVGDNVVVDGADRLREGSRVNIGADTPASTANPAGTPTSERHLRSGGSAKGTDRP